MDKNAIRNYAIWARQELISRVSQKAAQYFIDENGYGEENLEIVNGTLLTTSEKNQRNALIIQIKEKGYEQVMEEAAYTWFNRFIALRFMEVNGYLPSHIRVFTDDENNFRPQILTEAIHLEIEGLDRNRVYELKEANKSDELYKYLIITQCNALGEILPGMFKKILDYTELLFPDNILRDGSVIEQLVTCIQETDWKDAVQIIGWLYQFYNIDPKAKINARPKTEKISKDEIPAATQLFTPDWIVRYMVENSLGRLWLEGHADDELKSEWKYYMNESEQLSSVCSELEKIRENYKTIKPEDILCIDPCSGSGHIVVYMFDVLFQIYEKYGYTTREAVQNIVKKNIYALDIDDRAAQLAYFSVMMKARQYDARFFSRKIQPHIYSIVESNHVDEFVIDYYCNGNSSLRQAIISIVNELHDAKEYGSMLTVSKQNWGDLYTRFDEIREDISIVKELALNQLLPLVQVAEVLANQYDVTVTNPPYLVVSNCNATASEYVKKNYSDSKTDLFAVFIERCHGFTKKYGYQAMITMHSWMFLGSYETLRNKMQQFNLVSMAHLGARAFDEIGGEVVQTTAFVFQNAKVNNYVGTYARLVEPNTEEGKKNLYLTGASRYAVEQSIFSEIPSSPIAYWAPKEAIDVFERSVALQSISNPKQGLITGDVNRFVRKWYECSSENLSFAGKAEDENREGKWFPYCNGGTFRKWYGNNEDVVNWKNNGYEVKNFVDDKGKQRSRPQNQQFYYREGGTWSAISTSMFSIRYFPEGFLFSNAGMAIYTEHEKLLYIIGFLNSKLCSLYLGLFNEGINFNQGDIAKLPILFNDEKNQQVLDIVNSAIEISKADWNSYETSWDFSKHPLIKKCSTIAAAYDLWSNECENRHAELKMKEEELNKIFIDIYGLDNVMKCTVDEKNIAITKAECKKDVRNLISYAVGCMFGRYSLDVEGIVFSGGVWDSKKYMSYEVDEDNIIPICDDEYFTDDIVGRFTEFIKVIYGEDTLTQNLKFIADALGGKGQPKEVIRNYFINEFYSDHVRMYQKRPIYWLFDSGKKNGFKCLIYMHRYQTDTIARIRTDYIHEQQARYDTAIIDLEQRVRNTVSSERIKLNKSLQSLQSQAIEIRDYEEKIHHLADQMIRIDLDDGVNVNYEKFKEVLAKI